MKTANNYTAKDVTKMGKKIIFSTLHILGIKRVKLDRRFNFNKDVLAYVFTHQLSERRKAEVLAKRKERAKAKAAAPLSIFQLPILKDYLANKQNLRAIYDTHLAFYNRNHWAKTPQDKRILAVLKKHFSK